MLFFTWISYWINAFFSIIIKLFGGF